MRAKTLKPTIKKLIELQRTFVIEGAPGGGKTSIIRQMADELGYQYKELHGPTMLVEDFGIPWPEAGNDTFAYKVPEWYPAKGSKWDTDQPGVLCFDDRNQMGADLQKVMANIMQARNLHGVPIADNWTMCSTGNRVKDRAGSNRILSHLRNRETVLPFETNLDDWTDWAIGAGIASEVISFLRFKPALLHAPDGESVGSGDTKANSKAGSGDFDGAFPSPRSWAEGISPLIGAIPPEAERECFAGAVGEAAGSAFSGFLKIHRNLPNPDWVIMNPDKAEVPDEVAVKYALCGALAERATENNFANVCKYAERLSGDFSVLLVSYAARRNTNLADTKAFNDWMLKHKNVLF
ncbi:MAG: ATP-binding protein [Saprospiraceae bacterium]|nr:ATP-binding protein [Saprospiraceae bacterium]